MKVIHLISGGDSGGAKTHVLSLLQNLNQTITAQLVCFRDGPFAEEARSRGIPTEIMGGNNIPRLQRQLKAYIRAGGYQLIHCHGSRGGAYTPTWWAGRSCGPSPMRIPPSARRRSTG